MLKRAFLLAAVALALTAGPLRAAEAPRTISVTGTGEVTATPDIAYVTLGVRSVAMTAREALAQNSAAMNRVFAALRKAGVADKDMQTVNLSLNPRWRQQVNQDGTREQVQAGFEAANQLRVTCRDLAKLGGLLDSVSAAGANSMGGIRFDVAEADKLTDKARALAVEDARHRAELYARAAGVRLGRILSLSEAGGPRPILQPRAMALRAESVPVAQGEQSLSASVSVTYDIE